MTDVGTAATASALTQHENAFARWLGADSIDVRAALDDVRARGFEHVVLDLRDVSFMDSTGLHLVMEEHEAAKANGHSFSLMYDDGPVRRLFALSGLEGRVNLVPLSAELGAEPEHAQTIAEGLIQGS